MKGPQSEKMLPRGVKKARRGAKEAESDVKGVFRPATMPPDNESPLSENAKSVSAQRRTAFESENPVPPGEKPAPPDGQEWP